jgi:Ca2+-transporting ATPase
VIRHVNVDKRWYRLSIEETLRELGSGSSGLTETEAKTRLIEYGPNELQRGKKTSPVIAFFKQFLSPLIYILLVAAVISLAVEHYLDAGVILVVLLLNAVIGFAQESRAQAAMEALMKIATPKGKVIRNGTASLVPARDIVPGDIFILESGDRVPADARIIEASDLKVNEATLTGESVAADKHTKALREDVSLAEQKNMVHMGTTVSYGRAIAVTVTSGMATEIGKIARVIREAEPKKTPLQKSISKLSKYLVVIFIFICSLLIVIGVLQGLNFIEILLVAVAVAVSAIPEGLPAVVTVILALGMRAMAHRHAIIRKLVAVETLGAATVICTDKTGTLTLNKMTVREVFIDGKTIDITGEGYQPKGEFRHEGRLINPEDDESLMLLLKIGLLCNDALLTTVNHDYSILGDPTEGALVVVAAKAGLDKESLIKVNPRIDEIPFQSEKRYMATLHPHNGKRVVYVKGAPEQLLSMGKSLLRNSQIVPLLDADAQRIREASITMAREAKRVIAFAYMEVLPELAELEDVDLRGNLVFVGLVGMDDPPREDAIKAVALCKQAGIRVVMVTGDNQITAESVAQQVGLLQGRSITGVELADMREDELVSQIEGISVFARVDPLHKLRIVNALKSRDEVVAMTGDGVNDAPALKVSSIGIAMGINGTDVAKEASDMVLADDNFASIVAAVDEGRAIFNRLRNVIFYLLCTNIGELIAFLLSLIFVGQAPLVAVQIIWGNLVTDATVGIPLGMEPKTGDEIGQPPRHPKVGLIYPGMLFRIAVLASMSGLGVFGVFFWLYDSVSLDEARTMAFCTLTAFQLFRAVNARSDENTVFKLGLFSNRYLLVSIGIAFILQLVVVYMPFMQMAFHTVPISVAQWCIIISIAGSIFMAEELRKVIAPKLFSRGKWAPA